MFCEKFYFTLSWLDDEMYGVLNVVCGVQNSVRSTDMSSWSFIPVKRALSFIRGFVVKNCIG